MNGWATEKTPASNTHKDFCVAGAQSTSTAQQYVQVTKRPTASWKWTKGLNKYFLKEDTWMVNKDMKKLTTSLTGKHNWKEPPEVTPQRSH